MVASLVVVAMGVFLNGRRWITGVLAFACAVLCDERAAARTIDPSGSVVVCTEAAFQAAADELALHLKLITGEEIPVARTPGSVYNWFVGTAPDDDRGPFAPEEGRWRTSEVAAWFYGDTNVNRQAAAKTGVDMAVHAFLEDELGCRWPWADKVSVVEQNPIRLKSGRGTWKPPFRLRTIRAGKPGALWQARLRDGRHDLPPYYHAFTGYWRDYGREHPEYFAMRKDGKRLPPGVPSDRDDPTVYAGNMGRAISMCVSCEGLVDRVVENWRKDGKGPFINICENDAVGQNRCWCPACSALDEPQPSEAHPLRFGWFADRYVRFGNRVLEKARRIRPDVRVIYYGYNASEIAPRREKVAKGTVLGLVPIFFTPERMARYIGDWKAAGADAFFYRPNRHHYFKSVAIPLGNEEYFFNLFKLVAAANPIGFDYDATGKTDAMAYFRDYVIYKGMQDPTKDFAHWENHYCQAFGAAKDDVRDFFRIWRGVWKEKLESKVAVWTKENPDFGRPFSTHLPDFYKLADVDRGIAVLERGLARPGLTANHRALVCELREAQDETRLLVRAATEKTEAAAKDLVDWRMAHGKDLVPFGESYYDDFTGVVAYIRKSRPELLSKLPKHVMFYAERREKEAKKGR